MTSPNDEVAAQLEEGLAVAGPADPVQPDLSAATPAAVDVDELQRQIDELQAKRDAAAAEASQAADEAQAAEAAAAGPPLVSSNVPSDLRTLLDYILDKIKNL